MKVLKKMKYNWYSILVSGVQHSDPTIIYITKYSHYDKTWQVLKETKWQIYGARMGWETVNLGASS